MGFLNEQVLLQLSHEVEGELTVRRTAKGITVRTRWPFDLMDDDFIEISETFSFQEWRDAIDSAKDGRGMLTLRSAKGAFLNIRETVSGAHIEIGSRRDTMSRSIELVVSDWHGLEPWLDA